MALYGGFAPAEGAGEPAGPLTPTNSSRSVLLEELANASARIARVRILAREPVWIDPDTRQPRACGYVYRATVVDPIKGGSEPFEFFAPVDADFAGYAPDYLVFAYQRTVKERGGIYALDPLLSSPEQEALWCRTSQGYYAALPYQTMRAFDLEAASKFGGEWLASPNRTDIVWCRFIADQNPDGEWPAIREKVSGDASTKIINWVEAKKLILKALTLAGDDG
jgi:hypothetical protein